MKALVTGASRGIGEQYATVLARDYKCDLLLVSHGDALQGVADRIATDYGVNVQAYRLDLSEPDAADVLYAKTKDIGFEPDILINNAGVFFFNPLTETDMERIEQMLMINVVAITKITRLFAKDMCERKSGYILNMSSLSTWMAFPGIQEYNATKAYINNFTRSMWYELKPHGVHIITVTPGMVNTTLYGLPENLRTLAVKLGINTPTERLAKKALRRMFHRRKKCMPGLVNHIFKPLLAHFPDWPVFLIMKRIGKYQK